MGGGGRLCANNFRDDQHTWNFVISNKSKNFLVRNAVDLKIVPEIENSVNGSEKFVYRLKNENIVDCQKKIPTMY